MSSPFLGEIRMFAGTFAPRGWALCDGQLVLVSQNDALFLLVGTIYGGDGRTTFGLPDLRGRAPIHQGSGIGLSPRSIGSKGGSEEVTITQGQLPPHQHAWQATDTPATETQPAGNVTGGSVSVDVYRGTAAAPGDLASQAIENAGEGAPAAHENVQPYAVLHYIIALVGLYPSRN